MPEGFEPEQFLERIYTLREVIIACQRGAVERVQILNSIARDPNSPNIEKMHAIKMLDDRAYGKPNQSVQVTIGESNQRRVLELPASGRERMVQGPLIDAQAQ